MLVCFTNQSSAINLDLFWKQVFSYNRIILYKHCENLVNPLCNKTLLEFYFTQVLSMFIVRSLWKLVVDMVQTSAAYLVSLEGMGDCWHVSYPMLSMTHPSRNFFVLYFYASL